MGIGTFLIGKIVENERKKFEKDVKKQQMENQMPEGVQEKAYESFHIYLPQKCDPGAMRVILNVHGGGMIMGNRIFNRYFNARFSAAGYAVLAAEYPLTPENELPKMVEGLTRSIRQGLLQLEKEGCKTEEVYLTADSAGAFLSLYMFACARKEELRRRMGIEASVFEGFPKVKGMGLLSGMYYSRRKDSIGRFVGPLIWGKGAKKRFEFWLDLEYLLTQVDFPKLFLFTAEGDFLKEYTQHFYQACRKNGQEVQLKVFQNPELVHAFQVFQPWADETMQTIQLLNQWFTKEGES